MQRSGPSDSISDGEKGVRVPLGGEGMESAWGVCKIG